MTVLGPPGGVTVEPTVSPEPRKSPSWLPLPWVALRETRTWVRLMVVLSRLPLPWVVFTTPITDGMVAMVATAVTDVGGIRVALVMGGGGGGGLVDWSSSMEMVSEEP